MRGNYSYDIKDSETFKTTFMVELKLNKYREERER
jgi:hypothetical protein